MWTYLLTYCGKPVQEPDGVDDELVEESYDSSLLNRWDLKKERIVVTIINVRRSCEQQLMLPL